MSKHFPGVPNEAFPPGLLRLKSTRQFVDVSFSIASTSLETRQSSGKVEKPHNSLLYFCGIYTVCVVAVIAHLSSEVLQYSVKNLED